MNKTNQTKKPKWEEEEKVTIDGVEYMVPSISERIEMTKAWKEKVREQELVNLIAQARQSTIDEVIGIIEDARFLNPDLYKFLTKLSEKIQSLSKTGGKL